MATVNYAYTRLNEDSTMWLDIAGAKYQVIQFSASFAKNTIPECVCMVALGRNARNPGEMAQIHETGMELKQMLKAKVWFEPKEDYSPGGDPKWPEGAQVIFDGYVAGFSYRKINEKIQAGIHLIHWCTDLTYSTMLHRWMHSTNPTNLMFPAITPAHGEGGRGLKIWLGNLTGYHLIHQHVLTDTWKAMKALLCSVAQVGVVSQIQVKAGDGSSDKETNVRALEALKAFEVDCAECPFTPRNGERPDEIGKSRTLHGVFNKRLIAQAVARGLDDMVTQAFPSMTFWDVMITRFIPMYHLAVIPIVSRGLVIADAPYWQAHQKPYREIPPEDYAHLRLTGRLPTPLRGVGIMSHHDLGKKIGFTDGLINDKTWLGGVYSVGAEHGGAIDGVWKIMQAPEWLKWQNNVGETGCLTGSRYEESANTSMTDTPPTPSTDPSPVEPETLDNRKGAFTRFARAEFCRLTLQGRGASFEGKLRFDICPGSIIKLQQSSDKHMEGVDELAVALWGQVQQVQVNINAESRKASTSFVLTHVRTEKENSEARTSSPHHPMYNNDVFKGGYLVQEWAFD